MNTITSKIKTIFRLQPKPKTPLGRWCHKEYVESCCSKVQDRKAELANLDNSFDVRKEYKNIYNSDTLSH